MQIKKIFKYIFDYDIKNFIKYIILHPKGIVRSKQQDRNPMYLSELLNDNSYLREKPNTKNCALGQKNMNGYQNEKTIWSIHLAGVDINNLDPKDMKWERTFQDPEDMAAYHRFIWLYSEITKEQEAGMNGDTMYENVLSIIHSWIKSFDKCDKSSVHFEVWQTYTVVERVVNWLYTLIVLSRTDLEDHIIINSIQNQLDYICKNLEYYGEAFTGNHLCNDGKGLYIGGILLNLNYYAKIGKKILLHEADRIIVDNYFLREGSIHYQFLITKNYTDVYWIAIICGDIEFAKEIQNILRKLVIGCSFFLHKNEKEEWDFPRIGDVSPDYPPSWIIGTPWVAKYLMDGDTFVDIPKTIGYHTFFLKSLLNKEENENILKHNSRIIKSNDWGRITAQDYQIYAHVNHSLYPNNLTGHFHHDTGGFVLYYKNQCFLTDCGRITYENSIRGTRDKGYAGHNILSIDNMNPEIDMRTVYPPEFLDSYAEKAPTILSPSENALIIINYGYNRIKGIKAVTRKIVIEDEKVVITDILDGKGEHDITLLFHVIGSVEIKDKNDLHVLANHTELKITLEQSIDQIDIIAGKDNSLHGHYSSEYGKDEYITSIILKKKVNVPITMHTVIEAIE